VRQLEEREEDLKRFLKKFARRVAERVKDWNVYYTSLYAAELMKEIALFHSALRECSEKLSNGNKESWQKIYDLGIFGFLWSLKVGAEVEQRPFGAGVFISDVPPDDVGIRLSDSQGGLLNKSLLVMDKNDLFSLFQIADGVATALWVSTDGKIKGFLDLGKYRVPKEDLYFEMTKNGKFAVVIIPRPNPAYQIFYNGDLVLEEYYCRKKGAWRIRHFPELFEEDFPKLFKKDLALESGIDQGVLKRIVYAAVTLSHESHGAIFVVGEEGEVKSVRSNGKPMGLRVEASVNVRDLSIGALCNLARRDGATIIDAKGNLLATAWKLNPSKECCQDEQGRRLYGSRHLTACNISCEVSSGVVVTVSADNLITFFKNGRKFVEF